MTTKNTYLRCCPTTTKLLLGVVAGLLTLICETSFAADIKVWNFRQDFLASTSVFSQPVIKDQVGRDTWFLKYSYDPFTTSTSLPMSAFYNGFEECSPDPFGFKFWTSDSYFPYFGVNSSGIDQPCNFGITIPAGITFTHPRWDAAGIVEFHSSFAGPANIVATVNDLDPNCGNGVAVFLGKNGTQLSSGTVDNGSGNFSFSKGVIVKVGDILYVGVGPRDGDYACDTTQLDIVVSRPPDGTPFGPQGQGCGLTQ